MKNSFQKPIYHEKAPATVERISFYGASEADIIELEVIYKHWYRGNCDEERFATGMYLNDAVDFRALKATHYDGQPVGRVYCWEENGQKLAYLLAFDTLDFRGRGSII